MATNNAVNTSLFGQTGTVAFVGSTNPALTNPRIDTISDSNNLPILTLLPTASAVNYIAAGNASVGNAPGFSTVGSDADINFTLLAKGSAQVRVLAASNNPFSIFSGTTFQHGTRFNFANTNNIVDVTFPDATGTLLMTGQAISTVPSIAFSSTSGIIGTTTNNNAAAGSVGEIQFNSGSAIALTSTVVANVTSIVIPAGDWDVHASVLFLSGGATTVLSAGITPTSTVFGSSGTYTSLNSAFGTTNNGFPVPYQRLSLAAPTTYYLVAQATFVTSCQVYGNFWARRIR